jgi:FkbM family methyltransferase
VNSLRKSRPGEVHCIEPLPGNYAILKEAAEALKWDAVGLTVTHAAVASTDGSTLFPKDVGNGQEDVSLSDCDKDDSADCEKVSVYSLSTYYEKYVTHQGRINILLIDVEGYDFEVLFGAGPVLDVTDYLEFEYHNKGPWKRYDITNAIRLLDSKGFTCYWRGEGKLWQITECMHDTYSEWHNWSNVACVHRSQSVLSTIMENTFLKTISMS